MAVLFEDAFTSQLFPKIVAKGKILCYKSWSEYIFLANDAMVADTRYVLILQVGSSRWKHVPPLIYGGDT